MLEQDAQLKFETNLKETFEHVNGHLRKKIVKNNKGLRYTKGFSRKKYLGGVGTPSIIWGTNTRILIIFGVPPHKYKYLPRK